MKQRSIFEEQGLFCWVPKYLHLHVLKQLLLSVVSTSEGAGLAWPPHRSALFVREGATKLMTREALRHQEF